MPVFQTSAAGFAVLTTAEAKEHLAVLHSDHDTLIAGLVGAATTAVENMTGCLVAQRNVLLTLEFFPHDGILLPRPPVQSVTSIQYYDDSDTLQTWSATEYVSDVYADSPWVASVMSSWIKPAYGLSWPTVYGRFDAIHVAYVSGWKAAADVPGDIVQAIKLLIGDMYEHREETVTGPSPAMLGAVTRYLAPYRAYGADVR